MNNKNLINAVTSMINKSTTPSEMLNKKDRFSISLTNLQNKRLEILSSKIEVSKQEFIQTVVEAAMRDLENNLNLVDSVYISSLGETIYEYKSSYVREIIELLGLTEEDWWELIEKQAGR